MGWRERLHLSGKGSFRGVEFYVARAESEVGRVVVVHEFIGRDKPFVEDKRRAPRKFNLECFLLGDGYDLEREKLKRAFEKPGAADLVHPYWGRLKVNLEGPVRITETPDEGGMCRFSVPVIEVGDDKPEAVVKTDTAASLTSAAAAVENQLLEDFKDAFDLSGVAEFFRTSIAGRIETLASAMRDVKGDIDAALNAVDEVGDAIDDLGDTAASLVLLPEQLANDIIALQVSVLGAITGVIDAVEDVLTSPMFSEAHRGADLLSRTWEALDAYGDDFEEPEETTAQREVQVASQRLLVRLSRTANLTAACRVAAEITFDSVDQAHALRDKLYAAAEELSVDASDALYVMIADLKATMVEHLNTTSADLPRVITYVPVTTLPALVIAYQLYGDATRDQELITRNNITDPGFVTGGVELEVLSDE